MRLRSSLPILGALEDIPNLITFAGALAAMAACYCALQREFNAALVLALWAHVADSLDGLAARRRPGRTASVKQLGKHLDSHADLLSGGAFPLVFLITAGNGEPVAVLGGFLLCAAGVLRLSYFDVHGLSSGAFVGLPLPHNALVLCSVYWFSLAAPEDFRPILLGISAILTAALHVLPIPFPKMNNTAILASVVLAIALSPILAGFGR
ncbi:CDP-alcohol phosphatidyltransferase family protein [Stappia sp.]|uniref:CDP-alcohol phosphatidyltransferase family protein n=1 Tax=Stappia sp. TaxID=1870903 RepID=UPI003A9A301D